MWRANLDALLDAIVSKVELIELISLESGGGLVLSNTKLSIDDASPTGTRVVGTIAGFAALERDCGVLIAMIENEEYPLGGRVAFDVAHINEGMIDLERSSTAYC